MNPLDAIRRHIYLLQAENYSLERFLKASFRVRRVLDPKIIWTPKLMLVSALALGLQTAVAYLLSQVFGGWIAALVLLYTFSFIYFLFLAVATIILLPIDLPLKKYLTLKAKGKVAKLRPKLKIVAITGSYGKTTTKEVVATILSQKLRVLKTPENFNTPLGISRFVLKNLDEETDVLVVEMGAYRRGDIRALCRLIPPDVAVLTGINESHLERFGSLENTVRAKFEILESLEASGLAVLNADSELVVKNYGRFFKGMPKFYSSEKKPSTFAYAKKVGFDPKELRLAFTVANQGKEYNFSVPFLGKYIAGTVGAALIIARELGLSKKAIEGAATKLKPLPHRLEVVSRENSIVVIDDSYNGNPDGANQAIDVLSQFKSYRRVYVTPGLVEMGRRSSDVHTDIGQRLAKVANLVVLIRNSVTGDIARGLKSRGFSENDIMWFDTAREAREALPNTLKAGDVVLFQNDWPENYI